jgi:hypothetical protein
MGRWMLNPPSCTSFSRCHSWYPNVYTKKVGSDLIILVLYVDDLILINSDPKILTHVKSSLTKKFEMTDLGYLHYFFDLQILQTKEFFFPNLILLVTFFVAFTWTILNQALLPFSLESNLLPLVVLPKYATLYHLLVGRLLYLTHTRSDISFVVGLVSRYMQTPHESHWKTTKMILWYV